MAHPGAGPEGFFGHADGSQEPPSPKLLGAGCPGSGVSGGQRGFDKRSDCVEGLKDQRISTREIFSIRMAMSDKVLVCGSVAFDTIAVFEGHFKDPLLDDSIQSLSDRSEESRVGTECVSTS